MKDKQRGGAKHRQDQTVRLETFMPNRSFWMEENAIIDSQIDS
ncbi:hypothetical protein [Halomonas sp. ISL-56]|nr:hypothetical protein [Halomonas sp. ISL-56]